MAERASAQDTEWSAGNLFEADYSRWYGIRGSIGKGEGLRPDQEFLLGFGWISDPGRHCYGLLLRK